MKLDPVLLEILVCPDCKSTLTVDTDNDELICTGCGLAYPVRDDIPVMLVDEARRPSADQPSDVPADADSATPQDGGNPPDTADPGPDLADRGTPPEGTNDVDSHRTS